MRRCGQQLQQDKSALGKARLHYFDLNKGPWSELDGQVAFLPGVPPKKLPGANFYPEDMTKEEFENLGCEAPNAQRGSYGFARILYGDPDADADKKLKTPLAVPYSIGLRAAIWSARRSCSMKPRH